MNAKWLTVSFTWLLLSSVAEAQPDTRPSPVRQDRPGPWDNDVLAYRLTDKGRTERLSKFERAGVPTVARLQDERLIAAFQHFPQDDDRNFDRVAVAFSRNEGQEWSKPEAISVEGLQQGLALPFDPTLVLLLDGRIRLYFTSNNSPDFRRSTPAIYSAVSDDGVHYKFEPGIRFAVEGRIVIDCAVALHEGVFHLIVPDNGTPEQMMNAQRRGERQPGGNGYHAISRDGLDFERIADVAMKPRNNWLGNMQSDNGRLVFFGTGPGPWPVVSTDGKSWSAADNATAVPGADPGAVKLRDGSWLLLVTGPPRPGTSTARQRPNPPFDRSNPANPPPRRPE